MASTTLTKRICNRCGLGGTFQCSGCQSLFCFDCLKNHRENVSTELNNIVDENKKLRIIYGHREKWSERPVFSQISTWERESINKIKQVAIATRDELRRLVEERNVRMDTLLIGLSLQLQEAHRENSFVETALGRMKEQLEKTKEELKMPFDVQIIPDQQSIHLIKLKMTMGSLTSDMSSLAIDKPSMCCLNIFIYKFCF